MAQNNLRYGISALDIHYESEAENDELLVDGNNGQIYYKREDGQLVSTSPYDYNKEELISAMAVAIDATSGASMVNDNTQYIVYNTASVGGTNNILDDSQTFDLDIKKAFTVSASANQMFLRFRGTDAATAVCSYINTHAVANSMTAPAITVNLKVKELPSLTESDVAISCMYNEMKLITFTATDTNTTDFEVKIKSVEFPDTKTVYDAIPQAMQMTLKSINHGNSVLELDKVDIAWYTDNISNPTLYDNITDIRLRCIMPTTEALQVYENNGVGGGSSAIVVSPTKPNKTCIWAKVINVSDYVPD